ncbi:hypothetical protein [Burkholderia ubonensis]|uniref:hypothetical protein n=1 Tax=Burkholderia ubonensis TaxID=101571 RepID=UPI0012FC1268|nr:hypothetical protein [Burkholderia ubonensis]
MNDVLHKTPIEWDLLLVTFTLRNQPASQGNQSFRVCPHRAEYQGTPVEAAFHTALGHDRMNHQSGRHHCVSTK